MSFVFREIRLLLVNLERRDPTRLKGKPVVAWRYKGAMVMIPTEHKRQPFRLPEPVGPEHDTIIIPKDDPHFRVAATEVVWERFD
jgi:hypothetical protein